MTTSISGILAADLRQCPEVRELADFDATSAHAAAEIGIGALARPSIHRARWMPRSLSRTLSAINGSEQHGITQSANTKELSRVRIRFAFRQRLAEQKLPTARTTLYVGLAVAGLAFWIPPLLRATMSEGESSTNPTVESSSAEPHSLDASAIDESKLEMTRLSRIDGTMVISFASFAAPDRNAAALRSNPNAIVLTTTIIGARRRAAVINGRLYREGDKFSARGESFQLANVFEDHIELVREGKGPGRHRVIVRTAAAGSGETPAPAQLPPSDDRKSSRLLSAPPAS
jgi:hypothetical protein